MKIHYYSGWFDETLPHSYLEAIKKDITDKKSLVLVWGCWAGDELIDFVRDEWLKPGNIVFEKIVLVDNRISKAEAHRLIREASALLLLGGDTLLQSNFFAEYKLAAPIKESSADIVMAFSAGAINMACKGASAKNLGSKDEKTVFYDGLGLDNFCYMPYFLPEKYELAKDELLPISQNIDIYASTSEGFIRTKGDEITIFGEVYLISGSEFKKI